jgi:hypothetical protein
MITFDGNRGGGSPSSSVAELITILREARQAQRQNEMAAAQDEVGAAHAQADVAREKAEAARGQAWLRFAMSMGEALNSTVGLACEAHELRSRPQASDSAAPSAVDAEAGTDAENMANHPSRSEARDEGPGIGQRRRDGEALLGRLSEAAIAADDAFGFGERIRQADVESAALDARARAASARADQVRIAREGTDDALADLRQCYRDLLNGQQEGGE